VVEARRRGGIEKSVVTALAHLAGRFGPAGPWLSERPNNNPTGLCVEFHLVGEPGLLE
jgi:hypothetical protein